MAGTCEYGEEPSGSKNAGNFLTSCRFGVSKYNGYLWKSLGKTGSSSTSCTCRFAFNSVSKSLKKIRLDMWFDGEN